MDLVIRKVQWVVCEELDLDIGPGGGVVMPIIPQHVQAALNHDRP